MPTLKKEINSTKNRNKIVLKKVIKIKKIANK